MTQRTRILIAVAILIVLAAAILGLDTYRRAASQSAAVGEPTAVPGSIPIRLDGKLVGSFIPADLERMERVSFADPEEGKTQEGWLLRDVILLCIEREELPTGTLVTVSSSSRDKSVQLTWSEIDQPENYVMFDLSNRGTLKLVSVLDQLNARDEWVQDVDAVEITRP